MNQILVSQKVYVTKEMKAKRKIYKIVYVISVLTVIALLIYYIFAEKNRNDQEALSKEIMNTLSDNTTVEEHAIVIALDDNSDDSQAVPIEIPNTPQETESSVKTSNGQEYKSEAIFKFDRLGITYPVLTSESEELLKISLCKYWGPKPNEIGNYCIVGHNYKSGKMFGKLSNSKVGDEVSLSDLNGNEVKYIIYNTYVVEPTDVSCTSQLTNGKRELTLITCTNYGQQRLVVKAREI